MLTILNNVADTKSGIKLDRSAYHLFTPLPTRWGDSDALGHINNAMLVRYLESGRVDYFRQVCDVKLAEDDDNSFVIASLEMGFLQQVHHPANLEIATRVSRLGNSSFDVDTLIFEQGKDQPLITSRGICVWFDLKENRSRPIPENIRETINQFEQRNLS